METNVTEMLKNKNITSFIDSYVDKKSFKDFKFNFEVKKFNEKDIHHKNFQLLGTTFDYYFRYHIAKVYKLKMSQLIAEKSLFLMKIHLLDFLNEEDNLIYNTMVNIIKKYKSLDVNLKTFPFLNLGMIDSYYRTSYFDKYNFWMQFNQFADFLENDALKTPLIDDYIAIKKNLNKLLYVIKKVKITQPAYLNPDLTQLVDKTLVKADADIIDLKNLWEIKTSLNKNIPISYIRQLILYYWLLKRQNKENKVRNFIILNPRATNLLILKVSEVLMIDQRDFLSKLDTLVRKEFKNAI